MIVLLGLGWLLAVLVGLATGVPLLLLALVALTGAILTCDVRAHRSPRGRR